MTDPVHAVGVELVQDISGISSPLEGFLRRYRHRVKTVLSDGSRSDVYTADFVDRRAEIRDAVAVAVFARAASLDETRLLLRRQVRYGAYRVHGQALTTELIAGLIEGEEPPLETARRELLEEAGIESLPSRTWALGPPFFVLPGVMTERIFPVAIEIDAATFEAVPELVPQGDGSPFEEGALPLVATFAEVDALIARGPSSEPGALFIADAKTELVLGRLRRALEAGTLG